MSDSTYKDYLKDLETYKKMLSVVTRDLCSDELNIAAKEILCGAGKKIKKHIEYLEELLEGSAPPED